MVFSPTEEKRQKAAQYNKRLVGVHRSTCSLCAASCTVFFRDFFKNCQKFTRGELKKPQFARQQGVGRLAREERVFSSLDVCSLLSFLDGLFLLLRPLAAVMMMQPHL